MDGYHQTYDGYPTFPPELYVYSYVSAQDNKRYMKFIKRAFLNTGPNDYQGDFGIVIDGPFDIPIAMTPAATTSPPRYGLSEIVMTSAIDENFVFEMQEPDGRKRYWKFFIRGSATPYEDLGYFNLHVPSVAAAPQSGITQWGAPWASGIFSSYYGLIDIYKDATSYHRATFLMPENPACDDYSIVSSSRYDNLILMYSGKCNQYSLYTLENAPAPPVRPDPQ